METKIEKKIKEQINKISDNLEHKSKKYNEKMEEINESFANYKNIVYKLITFYIVLYIIWLLFAIFINNKIQNLYDGGINGLVYSLIVLLIAFFIGFLYCADGYISALIKTPFSKVTFEINNSDLNKKEKEDLLFKITVSNESIRETIKKFGMLTLTTEIWAIFISGKPMDQHIKNRFFKNIVKSNNMLAYIVLAISLLAYLIPLILSTIYIWHIEQKLKDSCITKQNITKKKNT